MLLTVGLTCLAAWSQAAPPGNPALEQCRASIEQRYGAGREIRLVSTRRSGTGVSMKVAVRLDDGTGQRERVEFTTCRLPFDALPGRGVEADPVEPAAGSPP